MIERLEMGHNRSIEEQGWAMGRKMYVKEAERKRELGLQ